MQREDVVGLTVTFAVTTKFIPAFAAALGRVSIIALCAFALAVPVGLAFLDPPRLLAPVFVVQDYFKELT